jgi:pyruvate formate lyase activating enzyme
MIVGGLEKFSLNDYPGQTAAVIFTRGCNFRCRYCHNPELVLPEKYDVEIPLAVCITGGEPTQHSDLAEMIKKIKEMGFLVKLDTNGSRPKILEEIIKKGNIDYIAMDIKAPFEDYKKITGVAVDVEKLKKSVSLIINSGLPHEFRTTVVKSLTSFDDLRKIVENIKGADNYFLQKFVPAPKLNDQAFATATSYSDEELNSLASELSLLVKHCGVR